MLRPCAACATPEHRPFARTPMNAPADTSASLDTTITVLCADWCQHCRTFRDELSGQLESLNWVDIEDQDIDVDALAITSFPTVAVFHPPGVLRYLGPVKPCVDDLLACVDQARTAAPIAAPQALPRANTA